MNLNEFQQKAMTFRTATADNTYADLNLAAEVGEYLGLIAKARRDGINSEDAQYHFDMNVKKELGDVLWQIAACAEDHGYTLEDIAEGNIEKLTSRKLRMVIGGSGDNR